MIATLKPCTILMADDDPDDRLLVKDALSECKEEAGVADQLRFVEDGEDLMDYLLHRGRHCEEENSPRPDLILLDLNMPRKDGREALREIRDHPDLKSIPVVIFTTSRAETDIKLVYELGANSFITKPVQFDALVNTLSLLARYWLGVVELPSPISLRK
jgi:CheY-like chemotaxis protein